MMTLKVSVSNVANEKEPKQNCSPGLVTTWKAMQNNKSSNAQPLPLSPTTVDSQVLAMQTGITKAITLNKITDC